MQSIEMFLFIASIASNLALRALNSSWIFMANWSRATINGQTWTILSVTRRFHAVHCVLSVYDVIVTQLKGDYFLRRCI